MYKTKIINWCDIQPNLNHIWNSTFRIQNYLLKSMWPFLRTAIWFNGANYFDSYLVCFSTINHRNTFKIIIIIKLKSTKNIFVGRCQVHDCIACIIYNVTIAILFTFLFYFCSDRHKHSIQFCFNRCIVFALVYDENKSIFFSINCLIGW